VLDSSLSPTLQTSFLRRLLCVCPSTGSCTPSNALAHTPHPHKPTSLCLLLWCDIRYSTLSAIHAAQFEVLNPSKLALLIKSYMKVNTPQHIIERELPLNRTPDPVWPAEEEGEGGGPLPTLEQLRTKEKWFGEWIHAREAIPDIRMG
jgi:hypothetical protein